MQPIINIDTNYQNIHLPHFENHGNTEHIIK